jgi:hypothetical protein
MATISRRLDRLEQTSGPWSDIERLIEGRRFYDQLTERQKRRFCSMNGISRRDFEEIALSLFGDLHLLLTKFDQPTNKELAQIKSEIENHTFRN